VARPPKPRWGDLRARVLSALVLLPVAIGCLWLGGWAWVALVALGSVGLAMEYVALCGARESGVARIGVPAASFVAAGLAAGGWAWVGVGWLAIAGALVWRLAGRIAPALGVPYVGLTAVALIWLRADPAAGLGRVLFLLLVVWATDISAYVVGRVVGGPRLAPSISPGKTWSGAVGGLCGALLVGLLSAIPLGGARLSSVALPVAAVLGVVAQAGDLLESGIKRRYGVKDSGTLIPGHGGLLDRLDGVLTAAPAAALLAIVAGPGGGFSP
jgi:phosphatidate cytidylyltransferase